jgi:hypothetical protein
MYKILLKILKNNKIAILLTIIYAFCATTLTLPFVIESFPISSFLLILLTYLISIGKFKLNLKNILLGGIIAGTTITNGIVWLLANLLTVRNLKKVAFLILIPIIVCIISMLLNRQTPQQYIEGILTQFGRFSGGQNTYNSVFSNSSLDSAINIFLLSPFLFPKLINLPLRPNLNLGPLQMLSQSFPVNYLVGVIIYSMILFFIFKVKKDTLAKFILGVFIFNILLHVVLHYGLYEAFIYTGHYLFALILMLAYAVRDLLILKKRTITILLILALIGIAAYLVIFNLIKMDQIFEFLINSYPR